MPSFAEVTANKNFLSPLGYKFVITRLPNVDYFCQSIEFPSISLNSTSVPNPFQRIPVAGTEITYGNISVNFKIDEDLTNYKEIYNWMLALGFPESYEQYRELAEKSSVDSQRLRSDASLVILSSSKNPKHEVKFLDIFPVGLTGMKFDSSLTDVAYLEATAEFSYRMFKLDPTTTANFPSYQ
jgi:hypothetical protein